MLYVGAILNGDVENMLSTSWRLFMVMLVDGYYRPFLDGVYQSISIKCI